MSTGGFNLSSENVLDTLRMCEVRQHNAAIRKNQADIDRAERQVQRKIDIAARAEKKQKRILIGLAKEEAD